MPPYASDEALRDAAQALRDSLAALDRSQTAEAACCHIDLALHLINEEIVSQDRRGKASA